MGSREIRFNPLFVETDAIAVAERAEGRALKPSEFSKYWQRRTLAERFRRMVASEKNPVLLEDDDIELMRAEIGGPFESVASGKARLTVDAVEFLPAGGEPLICPLRDVLGITVFKQHKLEFRFGGHIFFFHIPNRHTSAYKWYVAYHTLRAVLSEGETA